MVTSDERPAMEAVAKAEPGPAGNLSLLGQESRESSVSP